MSLIYVQVLLEIRRPDVLSFGSRQQTHQLIADRIMNDRLSYRLVMPVKVPFDPVQPISGILIQHCLNHLSQKKHPPPRHKWGGDAFAPCRILIEKSFAGSMTNRPFFGVILAFFRSTSPVFVLHGLHGGYSVGCGSGLVLYEVTPAVLCAMKIGASMQ